MLPPRCSPSNQEGEDLHASRLGKDGMRNGNPRCEDSAALKLAVVQGLGNLGRRESRVGRGGLGGDLREKCVAAESIDDCRCANREAVSNPHVERVSPS